MGGGPGAEEGGPGGELKRDTQGVGPYHDTAHPLEPVHAPPPQPACQGPRGHCHCYCHHSPPRPLHTQEAPNFECVGETLRV